MWYESFALAWVGLRDCSWASLKAGVIAGSIVQFVGSEKDV